MSGKDTQLNACELYKCFPDAAYINRADELRRYASASLREAGVESYDHDAMTLMEWVCNISRSDFFANPSRIIPKDEIEKYLSCIYRRKNREPLQYIVGCCEFMGYEFCVDERVLIPRWDTEILVSHALELLKEKSSLVENEYSPKVLDLCCGSGCIGISISKLFKNAMVTLSDVSKDALMVAMENAERLGAEVTFVESDLFEAISNAYSMENFHSGYDMIISNPPYIKTAVIEGLMPEVRDHEPLLALDGKDDGLYFYRIIAREGYEFLKPGGILIIEIGCEQAAELRDILSENGYKCIETYKDLAGLDRVVCGVKLEEVKDV